MGRVSVYEQDFTKYISQKNEVVNNVLLSFWDGSSEKPAKVIENEVGHVRIEVTVFVIFYLPSIIWLSKILLLCTFDENVTHKTRMNNNSDCEG